MCIGGAAPIANALRLDKMSAKPSNAVLQKVKSFAQKVKSFELKSCIFGLVTVEINGQSY